MPWPLTRAGDGDYDAPDGTREANLVEHGTNFLLRSLRVAQPARVENVKIDGDVMIGRHLRDQGNSARAASGSWAYSACVVKT